MRQHSIVREGVVTGIIGAVILAVWYFILDTAGGQPLHTPNVLGKIFFHGNLAPHANIDAWPVVGYTVVHFAAFIVLGIALALVTHLAIRNTSLRMGVWIGLLVLFLLVAGSLYGLSVASGERFSPWTVVVGSLLAVLGMAGYLWRGHPRLGRSFSESPLGSEVPPPPHPPERPRAA